VPEIETTAGPSTPFALNDHGRLSVELPHPFAKQCEWMGHGASLAGPANSLMPELAAAPSKMLVMTVDPNADVDVRGTAGLETRATFMRGCEPKDHERLFCCIGFGLGGAGVGDGEAAVAGDYYFQVGAVGSAFEVGDEGFGAVVGGVGVFSGVEHPEVFEAGAFVDGLPGLRAAGFVCTVVHDGDAGMDGVNEGFGVGEVEAVVVDEIEVDGADQIVGADEGDFLGFG